MHFILGTGSGLGESGDPSFLAPMRLERLSNRLLFVPETGARDGDEIHARPLKESTLEHQISLLEICRSETSAILHAE